MTEPDTPPTPLPTVGSATPPVPLPAVVRAGRACEQEDTERLAVPEDARTRPFVRRAAAAQREASLRDTPPEPTPSDELDFDRPLFPVKLAPPETKEAIDPDGYDRLVAASADGDLAPTPPWPKAPPPAILFDGDGTPLVPPPVTADIARGFFADPAAEDTDAETLSNVQEPSFLVPLPSPLPLEATPAPGSSPPSAPWVEAYPFSGKRALAVAAVVAVLIAIVVGVLAGVVLRRLTTPTTTPAAAPPSPVAAASRTSTPPPPAKKRPTRALPAPSVEGILARARDLAAREEHGRAFALFASALAADPANAAAASGYAASGVELGRGEVLDLLRRSRRAEHRALLPVLEVRLAMVNRRWDRADRLYSELPRRDQEQLRPLLWRAEIWRARGWPDRARRTYLRVLGEPTARRSVERIEAMLGLSEILVTRNRRSEAAWYARRALAFATTLGADHLRKRIHDQLGRCR
jgi:hypothetical protein